MEFTLKKLEDIYTKEQSLQSKKEDSKVNSIKNSDIKEGLDKIFIISSKQLHEEENKISENSKSVNNKKFSSELFEDLDEEDFIKFLETNIIPINFLNQVIKEVFKINKNKKNKRLNKKVLLLFIEKNKEKLTEKNIVLIIKKINKITNTDKEKEENEEKNIKLNELNEIMKYIMINIIIDENYFLELIKDEDICLNKNILNTFIENINDDKIKECWIKLGKTLNLIDLLKLKITMEEYKKNEKKLNQKIKELLNKEEKIIINSYDKEINKEINLDCIQSLKYSNSNKENYIEEKINI